MGNDNFLSPDDYDDLNAIRCLPDGGVEFEGPKYVEARAAADAENARRAALGQSRMSLGETFTYLRGLGMLK